MSTQLFDSLSVVLSQTLSSLSLFIPKIFGAFIAFGVGAFLANICKKMAQGLLKSIKFSSMLNKAPLQLAFDDKDLGKRTVDLITNVVYWLVMLVVIHTTLTILGLYSLTTMIERVLGYVPKVISAVFVLAFGILLAGWVESLVKSSIKGISAKTARVLGQLSSYVIVIIVVLASLSELGIASDFITILFIGLIGTLSLGFGLALGLGGKDLVSSILGDWYKKNHKSSAKK